MLACGGLGSDPLVSVNRIASLMSQTIGDGVHTLPISALKNALGFSISPNNHQKILSVESVIENLLCMTSTVHTEKSIFGSHGYFLSVELQLCAPNKNHK